MKLQRRFFQLLDKLISEHSPTQIRLSVVLGMFMGFAPIDTLHWALFVLAALVIRTNLLAVGLGYLVFAPISWLLTPLSHRIGNYFLLGLPPLQKLWAWLCHAPLVPFTQLNNTVVLGELLIALVISLPLLFTLRFLGDRFGQSLIALFQRSGFWRKWIYSRILQ